MKRNTNKVMPLVVTASITNTTDLPITQSSFADAVGDSANTANARLARTVGLATTDTRHRTGMSTSGHSRSRPQSRRRRTVKDRRGTSRIKPRRRRSRRGRRGTSRIKPRRDTRKDRRNRRVASRDGLRDAH